MLQKYSLIIFLLCLIAACGGSDNASPAPTPEQQANIAQSYLNEFLNVIQNNAVTRNTIDWGNLRSEVSALAANAQSIQDTYPAITRALELIGTNHSFLNAPDGSLITYPSTISCQQNFTMNSLDEPDIGYVRVDAVSASNGTNQAQQIAQRIQNDIASEDNPEVNAWIVDLRNNLGGNMWPMITGLGPLFDQPLLGYFVDANEEYLPWSYRQGYSYLGEAVVVQVDQPYTLLNPLAKIAVLVSQRTASSGEATMIAFKQQANVRFFGTDSCGLSTANSSFELSDGSVVFLTTAIDADRNQVKYGDRIPVDQPSDPAQALSLAVEWIRN